MEILTASVAICSTCRESLNVKGECLACLLRAGLDESVVEAAPHGSPVFGDFEIARREDGSFWELGCGAMGVTYRATDKVLHRTVALKVIETPAAAGDSTAVRERFLREARAAAALKHPNVAGIFQFGASPEIDRCYYAMELIDGETLEALVRRDGPLKVGLALEIAIQVTRALSAAAAQGLIHRDLKPGNIMLTSGDAAPSGLEVKVIDFGLAKATNAVPETDLTHGGFVGTPSFASPEQFGSAPADARSDIYSLGVTLWYALTGQVPYPGKTIEEIRDRQKHTDLPIEQLVERKIPASLIEMLRRTLALEPTQRPASARELMEALESCRAKLAHHGSIRSLRKLAGLIAVVAIAAAALFALRLNRQKTTSTAASDTGPPSSTLVPLPEKSIAVLPFENLSAEKNDAFFTDGIQDDVLTTLAMIKELKVISHTSVMAYRDAGTRNTREIGQTLGVANVLEGSVRRVGDRVVVNVQLIDTRTDRHLWAKHYDRTLTDSLGLQGEVANEITTVLQATLSPNEKARVQLRPTNSVPAYEAYLRGIAAEQRGPWRIVDLQDSARAFNEAVQIDQGFALAWAKLSIIHSSIYWMGRDRTAQRLAEARRALDKAGALDPDASQFYLARGYYHYWGEKNYEVAVRDFDEAMKRLPNSADALFALSLIDRRLGRWEEALTHMAQAARLNPRSSVILNSWGITLHYLRRFAEARALWDRGLESAPNDAGLIIAKAWSYQEEGDLETAAKLLQPLPPQPPDSEWQQVQYNQLLYERHFQQLIEMEQTALRQDGLSTRVRAFNLAALGRAQKLAGDDRAAHASFLAARDILERERRQNAPDDFEFAIIKLAFVHVGLGDREAALREAARALAVTANDTLYLPQFQVLVAQIHAQFGDADAALRDLPRLLQTPASDITPAQLRLDPIWDPIRNDSRFQELAALTPLPKKSIAVLPFENLSAEKNDAFFADGIQDDVLTSLATIKELKVISHTSVMAYRDAGARNTRQIGQTLGAANVLEGSVRRVGDRVAVNVQLIDTRSDRHIWAKHYDRTLIDSLGLQGELANEIATVLRATLSPEEKAGNEVRPTSSVPAYEAYLRGRAFTGGSRLDRSNMEGAIRSYQEAVKLDPNFALAWAYLSCGQSENYWLGFDPSPARLAAAKDAAERALALDPNLAETHLALGYYRYYSQRDFTGAVAEFQQAEQGLPNNVDVITAIALIQRRVGHWDEAIAGLRRAVELDPRNTDASITLAITYKCLRRFPEALAAVDRVLAFEPTNTGALWQKAGVFWATGDIKAVEPLVANPGTDPLMRGVQALFQRRYADAIEILSKALAEKPADEKKWLLFSLGLGQQRASNVATARATYQKATQELQHELKKVTLDSFQEAELRAALGRAYAGLGEAASAIAEGQKAMAMDPSSKDPLDGPEEEEAMAQIYALLGDSDHAIPILKRLLQIPAGQVISAGLLRIDPIWDQIRNDPRFHELVEDKKP